MSGGKSTRYRGWSWDEANTRLDVYVSTTNVAIFDDSAPSLTVVNGLTVSTGDITLSSGTSLKTTAADNSDISMQVYVTGSTAYVNAIEVQSVTAGTAEIGFFGKTPAAQQSTEATVSATGHGTTINSLIGKLENLGLLATS